MTSLSSGNTPEAASRNVRGTARRVASWPGARQGFVRRRRALHARTTLRFLSTDAYRRYMLRLTGHLPVVRDTGAQLRWAIDGPHALERAVPRLRPVAAVPFLTMPVLIARMARSRLQRAMYGLIGPVGLVDRFVQHLRYRF